MNSVRGNDMADPSIKTPLNWVLRWPVGVTLLACVLGCTSSTSQTCPAQAEAAPGSSLPSAPTADTQVPSVQHETAPAHLNLSLQQAIQMALKNNLDIQLEQVNQSVADSGVQRARGGGTATSINFAVSEVPAGLGPASTPLLASASPLLSPDSVNPSGISVASSYDAGHVIEARHSLSVATTPFSAGAPVPAFDPELQGQLAWFRRDPSNSIQPAAAASVGDVVATDNTLGNVTFLKGFASGASVQLGINDFVQSFYSGRSSAVPFSKPNATALLVQPLLRGAGQANNKRFIVIAKTNQQIASTVLEQQMISTIAGVEALYYDLVSLQNMVAVQRSALSDAQRLLDDDKQQLAVGRMPPIEVSRAETLVAANRLGLTQTEALREQQGNILRSVVDPASLTESTSTLLDITATDAISSASEDNATPLNELLQRASTQRPDIRQAKLQVSNGERSVAGSLNARLPEVDLYGTVQSRGVIAPGLLPIGGDPLTGASLVDPIPAGGKSASQLFEAGIQFNLPIGNKVTQANLGADRAELRQERLRLAQIEAQAAAEVRNAMIALAAATHAVQASTESRRLQEHLLNAEMEKFRAGMSTNFAVIQQQTYLVQAKTTEVAAQAAWKKAQVQLQRALGETLQEIGITIPSQLRVH